MADSFDPREDPDYNWDDPEITEEALEALKMEREVLDVDYKTQALRILQESAPGAALGMVALARGGSNENVRMNAQKYILDFVRDPDTAAGGQLLEDLIGDLVVNAEKLANGRAM